MFPRIKDVRYIKNFVLELTFADDKIVQLDFEDRIVGRGGVFSALENVAFFEKVQVDADARTLVWPNGVDFCPDVLYSEATGAPLTIKSPAQSKVRKVAFHH